MPYKRDITSEKLSKEWIYSNSLKGVKCLKPLEKFRAYNITQTEKHLNYLYTATSILFPMS
jgi:hypothetical protein